MLFSILFLLVVLHNEDAETILRCYLSFLFSHSPAIYHLFICPYIFFLIFLVCLRFRISYPTRLFPSPVLSFLVKLKCLFCFLHAFFLPSHLSLFSCHSSLSRSLFSYDYLFLLSFFFFIVCMCLVHECMHACVRRGK